ncbi:MAG: AIR synthase-related protein [Kofleriaceae bacterium]
MLTKALGTGIVGQAIKQGVATDDEIAAAVGSMTTLNQGAARIGHAHGVTAATDVTGFGLLGHLRNIVRGSGVGARIALDQLPLLPGAREHLRANRCPAGSKANRAFVAELVRWHDGAAFDAAPGDEAERELLSSIACDAQTSGGLLLCLPAERAVACVAALRAEGLPAAQIGELVDLGHDGARIELC